MEICGLNNKEKKAIVELNHFSNMTAHWKQEEYTNSEIDNYIKIILNLIESQQKEIEELKKPRYLYNAHTGEITKLENSNCISKDKIKVILEEYKYTEIGDSDKIIEFYKKIQSLLEEE